MAIFSPLFHIRVFLVYIYVCIEKCIKTKTILITLHVQSENHERKIIHIKKIRKYIFLSQKKINKDDNIHKNKALKGRTK